MYNDRTIRSATALTNDQMRRVAPSIFAERPWHAMSEKYAFIPTIAVVDALRAEGFVPVEATQSLTRVPGKGDFTKHMLKFRDMRSGGDALALAPGKLRPEALLTNSHDGASAYTLMMGIFVFICSNGLVVGDHLVPPVKIQHRGDPRGVIDATFEVVEQAPRVAASIDTFQALRLEAPEQRAFANAALALKYDGPAPIDADQALMARRVEDREPTLWNTFNRVQESLLTGGNRYRAESGRRMRTRPVQGIAENTKLNKALWTLAEEMVRLKG